MPFVSPITPLPAFADVPGGVLEAARGHQWERPETPIAPFRLGLTQVSNAEYDVFVRAAGRSPAPLREDPDFRAPDQPVVSVSWFDAQAYCAWLSERLGAACRLPTEDEWEWAARGGLAGARYPWGDEEPEERYPEYARLWARGPEPVGRQLSNRYGLFEMCENTHEWCANWHDVEETRRASKGGSWRHQRKVSACVARSSISPELRYADYGFRVAI